MDEDSLQGRLSRISTTWTLLVRARQGTDSQAHQALVALVRRYQGAVYRYLLCAVRDPDVADELFQEFALRLVRGSFGHADPRRGRFRDYVKTALVHLVTDYWKRQHKRPATLDASVVQPVAPSDESVDAENQFRDSWRAELLARAWQALADAERKGGQPYYSVLRFRAENLTVSSSEMAARLSETLHPQRPFTDVGMRKMLQRARTRFAELLIDDVGHSLGPCAPERLEEELIELGLHAYCRSALH